MNIQEVTKYLLDHKYLVKFGNKYYTTTKFEIDLKTAEETVVSNLPAVVQADNGLAVSTVQETTKQRFNRFKTEACVPYRIEGSDGRGYTANAHSVPAERIFNKALADGYNWNVLVFSTRLYYSGNGFRVKLSNYFIQGIWESEYDEAIKKAAEGKLPEYVNERTNNNNSNMMMR